MAKPTRSDLLTLGLPAPAVVQIPQAVERVDAATGTLYLRAHGLSLDDALELRLVTVTTPGATAGELPIGLSEGVTYYARPVTDGSFRLAASAGGSAIALHSAGVGRFHVLLDSGASLDRAIDDAWALISARLTAHGGDVEADVITVSARYLAARLWVAHTAAGDAARAESFAGLVTIWESEIRPMLDAYFRGVPVRGATDATPTVSEGSPRYRVLGPAAPTSTTWGTSSSEVV